MEISEALSLAGEMRDKVAPTWKVKLFRSKFKAGYADHGKQVIGLSVNFIEVLSEREVKNLVRHELGHVVVGPGHNHDRTWARAVRDLGGKPEPTTRARFPEPPIVFMITLILATVYGGFTYSPVAGWIIGAVWALVILRQLWSKFGPINQMYNLTASEI